VGDVVKVAPQLDVGEGLTGGSRERRSVGHGVAGSAWARISARCIVRTPARPRASAPPICIRQELSAAVQTSAPVPTIAATLSATIANEVSAFLTANVPPKPQHSVAAGSS